MGCCGGKNPDLRRQKREEEDSVFLNGSHDSMDSESAPRGQYGSPLPILNPSDLSVDADDVLDVVEKGLCG